MGGSWIPRIAPCLHRTAEHLLLMPVVNLVNISKHNFILSSHVLRDTLFFYSLHEAL